MNEPIDQMLGLGPKSSEWLREVGISTRDELERVGVVEAYLRVKATGRPVSLNLLWALQGAVMDIHWTLLDPKLKAKLKAQVQPASQD